MIPIAMFFFPVLFRGIYIWREQLALFLGAKALIG